ncbi:hypothetical protein EVAR_49704_1 [Eumeta japonica]|uniref:Uncharacterized protein n=1 Tax=Eumeta variegata TaxID=151549 RepID=A0A4C1Z5P8_EUMVA|nr:hypothetical protein EVAR_49704_1 [Eumeta japonica]
MLCTTAVITIRCHRPGRGTIEGQRIRRDFIRRARAPAGTLERICRVTMSLRLSNFLKSDRLRPNVVSGLIRLMMGHILLLLLQFRLRRLDLKSSTRAKCGLV